MKRATLFRSSIVGASVALHAWFAFGYSPDRPQSPPSRDVTEVELTEVLNAPPPPAPEPQPPPEETAAPLPSRQSLSPKAAQPRAHVAPTAAMAAKTLTAPEDAPADLADFTLVQGNGRSYAGGTTSSTGLSKQAVRGAAATSSRPSAFGSSGSTVPAGGVDRSRAPLPQNGAWDCSRLYPAGAAPDSALVRVVVTVNASGRAISVAVLSDPGFGFGDAARRCALSQRFSPGLDRDGRPAIRSTAPIRVRFSR